MEDWGLSLGNTLLASIVCLVWYLASCWEERTATPEEEPACRDPEKEVNTGVEGRGDNADIQSDGCHLYLRANGRAEDLLREHQSAMQLRTGRTRGEEPNTINPQANTDNSHANTGTSHANTNTSHANTGTSHANTNTSHANTNTFHANTDAPQSATFQWPQQASVAKVARSTAQLDTGLEGKLKELGILRTEQARSPGELEEAARDCGVGLTRKQVRLSFDMFMAKSRPGLESDEEVKESPKPKKNKKLDKKPEEPRSWLEDKANQKSRTGWDNPAWHRVLRQETGASLVRAF